MFSFEPCCQSVSISPVLNSFNSDIVDSQKPRFSSMFPFFGSGAKSRIIGKNGAVLLSQYNHLNTLSEIPHRDAFNPEKIKIIVPWIFILDISYDAYDQVNEIVVRLQGEQAERIYGNLKGKNIQKMENSNILISIEKILKELIQHKVPISAQTQKPSRLKKMINRFILQKDPSYIRVNNLLVPFSNNGKQVHQIMGVLDVETYS